MPDLLKITLKPHVAPELILKIGEIAMQWANLGLMAGIILGGLSEIDRKEWAGRFYWMDTREKIKEIKKLLASANIQEPTMGQLQAAMVTFSDLAFDRNLTIHGVVVFDEPTMDNPKLQAFRGQFKETPVPLTLELLNGILDDINKTTAAFTSAAVNLGFAEHQSA